MSILNGIRVVEFAEGVAGPMAGARLVQLGAEVIKVERKDGDWLRGAAPQVPGRPTSAAFSELNAGKKSVQVGGNVEDAVSVLRSLLSTADVFITDSGADELALLGIGDTTQPVYPPNKGLITLSVSPWGDKGPWRDHKGSELAAQAVAGYTRYLGSGDAPARRLGADVASTSTGVFAGQAILAALFARKRNGGKGQRITVSLLNSLLCLKSIHLAAQTAPDQYAGPRVGGANYPPERGWETKDENIFFSFGGAMGGEGRPGWLNFLEEIGSPALAEDARFDKSGRNSTGYGINVPELKGEYEREFSRHTGESLVEIIRKHSGTAATYQRSDQAIRHPQALALNILREAEGENGSPEEARAFPARYSRSRTSVRRDVAMLGEHSAAVALEAGFGPAKVSELLAQDALRSPTSAWRA